MSRFRVFPRNGPPLVIAHRGASMIAPENTLEAGILGHRSGAFAWELDVHLSRDGVPVVIHDETLTRTTDVTTKFAGDPREENHFRVADFDWHEIRTLDAGSWFVQRNGGHRSSSHFQSFDRLSASEVESYRSGAVRVPSLDEALQLTAQLDWLVNVELKVFSPPNPLLREIVLETIDRLKVHDRVLISSFDHTEVAHVALHRPEIATGALSHTPLYRADRYIREIVGADFHHISHESVRSPEGQSRLSLEEPPTFVYTVNDVQPQGLTWRLAQSGIAGVFTDDPSSLVKLLGRWPGRVTRRSTPFT